MEINVIDLFAGPGGLGEGFSAFRPDKRKNEFPFRVRMSVEKESSAHKTLTTRALYRALKRGGNAKPYFDYLEKKLSFAELCAKESKLWSEVSEETLSRPTALGEDNETIYQQLRKLKKKHSGPWVVIGGPPCQAYSLVGRSRNKGKADYKPEGDERHFLYQEYLEVLAEIQPEVFVMENVKGILTAKVHGQSIFPQILEDLEFPVRNSKRKKGRGPRYLIHSFVVSAAEDLTDSFKVTPSDFVIRTEDFGVPQARHRVILLGVREDVQVKPGQLKPSETAVPLDAAIGSLPKLRSRLSKERDDLKRWQDVIRTGARSLSREVKENGQKDFANFIFEKSTQLFRQDRTRSESYRGGAPSLPNRLDKSLAQWLLNDAPPVLLNHESRGHIAGDLVRYFFCATWAEFKKTASPKASNFPDLLRPAHANWESGHFADRFRVQTRNRPATTVTSHISKDGHYFIHYDATQCRSFTVREAARIQTFPDNYVFEGNRTQQYVQVGNAVPPFLALQLAESVYAFFTS